MESALSVISSDKPGTIQDIIRLEKQHVLQPQKGGAKLALRKFTLECQSCQFHNYIGFIGHADCIDNFRYIAYIGCLH